MTCFWDGLIKALDDFTPIGLSKKPTQIEFVIALKKNNKKCKNIYWNGTKLRDQEIEEMYKAIEDFNPKSIYGGYLCSTCDCFLALVCEIFNVNIHHKYLNNIMKYKNIKTSQSKILKFNSNSYHFWH